MALDNGTAWASSRSHAAAVRDAVSRLRRVVAWRAEEWSALRAEREGAERAARAAHAAAVAEASASRDEKSARLAARLEKSRLELAARHDAARREAATRGTRERDAEAGRLETARRRAESSLRDAKFLSDAVSDAGRSHPALEVDRVRAEAKAELDVLDALEHDARRLAGPRVPFPDTRAAAAAGGPAEAEEPEATPTGERPALDQLKELRVDVEEDVARLGGFTLHTLFRLGLPIVVVFVLACALVWAAVEGVLATSWAAFAASALVYAGPIAVVLVLLVPLRSLALSGTRRRVEPLAAKIASARSLAVRAVRQAQAYRERAEGEIRARREEEIAAHRAKYEGRLADLRVEREATLGRMDAAHAAELERLDAERRRDASALEAESASRSAAIDAASRAAMEAADGALASALAAASARAAEREGEVRARWREDLARVGAVLAEATGVARGSCPPWDELAGSWSPRRHAAPAVALGRVVARIDDLPGGRPEDASWMEGVASEFEAPLLLDFPGPASLLVLSDEAGREAAIGVLRDATLRLLTTLPPGKVRLTMIDPVGLGQSFAGLMRLADHDEKLVTGKIWTELRHIEARLADLTEHMETVIQKYLRNEFETIEAYNEAAGEIAEPYRFLVVADLPKGFSDEAARRLMSVIESGPRCGVFTLLHADAAAKMPETASLATVAASSLVLRTAAGGFAIEGGVLAGLGVEVESPPRDADVAGLLDALGAAALTAGRVEVPFERLVPPSGEGLWSRDASEELEVPLGRAGATRHQTLRLGRGTSQHALIAGKTGSGKSTLLHVMITTSAMWYGPGEVEYYLVDFKKGVEFKAYAGDRLPHARAVAVESDREFGLSVLHRLDEELRRRGDLFRALAAQSLAQARRASPGEHLPRVLLVIDEFQEFFTEDDKVAQDASLLLDRLVRQGRAFGMHVLLGSQTLSGAYSLARSTVGQMAVRIALQCSETDSYLILSEDNAAARMLSRPGEAIYNDANGMLEGNSPFQVAWLSDEQRDAALTRVRARAEEAGWRPESPQIVFEGNVPADLSRNHLLWRAAEGAGEDRGRRGRAAPLLCWLGEPVAIKDPTAGVLRRQAGSNLLVLGQQDETARAMIASTLVGLAAQIAGTEGAIRVVDATPPDDPDADALRRIAEALGAAGGVSVEVAGPRALAEVLAELDAERASREEDGGDRAPTVLVLHGLHRLRALRKKDEGFNFSFSAGEDDGAEAGPAARLADLLREGPPLGLHVVAWCDTYANVLRTMDRQALGEFEQRVVLQMSASDSSNVIDSPAAGKLGTNRGLLFTEEFGSLEKFRPYSAPSGALVERVAAALGRRAAGRA